MRVPQGGTQMWCPYCVKVTVCEGISPTELGKPSGRRWTYKEHEDIQWFRRGRRWLSCNNSFVTAEVDEDFLYELVDLRIALAHVERNAEEYMKESTAASAALGRLTNSLQVLRALKIYQDSENWSAKPLSDLRLSVRVTTSLEAGGVTSVGELCKRSADDLLNFRNFGVSTLNEVRQRLAKVGLRLRGE